MLKMGFGSAGYGVRKIGVITVLLVPCVVFFSFAFLFFGRCHGNWGKELAEPGAKIQAVQGVSERRLWYYSPLILHSIVRNGWQIE